MANNGYIQATIAYKVSRPGGEPIDVNGDLVSLSGLRQAVLLLIGTPNPNPALYEVENYFNEGAEIQGAPTVEYDPEDCPTGIIYVTPIQVLLEPNGEKVEVSLFASTNWETIETPTVSNISQTSGPSGFSYLDITPNTTEGQGFYKFRNTGTGDIAQLYVISATDLDAWVLDGGIWNGLGFWASTEIWNF